MRKVPVPLEKEMKKAVSITSFNPRKYLKRINFKKMTEEEALQVEAMAKTVNTKLYEIVKAKLSKRSSSYDVMIKARRCLKAIEQWNQQKNDEITNNPNIFDFQDPNCFIKYSLEPEFHLELIQCKDYDRFLQQKKINRMQLIDHIVKINYLFRNYQKQQSEEESAGEEDQRRLQEQFSNKEEDDPLIISQSTTEKIKSRHNYAINHVFNLLKWLPCFSLSSSKSQKNAKLE